MSDGRTNKNWNRGGKFQKKPIKDDGKKAIEVPLDSPVLLAFQQYRKEIDDKHDKAERLVKMSRDITIESKRIIFLLHSNCGNEARGKLLDEAESRLMKLIKTYFYNISKELENSDPYQFTRNYCPGIQEFVEAYSFYIYLRSGKLIIWEDVQKLIIYEKADNEDVMDSSTNGAFTEDSDVSVNKNETEIQETNLALASTANKKIDAVAGTELRVLLTPVDYILGLEDLTGELMRHCVTSVSAGNIESVFQACDFVKEMYTTFSYFKGLHKEFYRKLRVLKQSLLKMEKTCYLIRVRGSEIPKHMLASVATDAAPADEDEGFC